MLVDLGSLAAPALDAALRGCRHPLGRLVAEDVVVAWARGRIERALGAGGVGRGVVEGDQLDHGGV